ncbi:HNH endonuclease signature motif containing protein [Demequina pelophila]|uniref:HNH endonuclease signature motif containing protein n=1 Tax=Demequina pelophila TaxID=1638984 RepID=UPI0007857EA5|nr:HNH endonuclease signature motif containing protein [Demequina pelophila]
MELSTARAADLLAGLGLFDGRDSLELEGAELAESVVAACELLKAVRLVAAPLAARAAADDGPDGLARKAGFRTPHWWIASLIGGTAGDALKLIEAGRAAEPGPDDEDRDEDGGPGPDANDSPDDEGDANDDGAPGDPGDDRADKDKEKDRDKGGSERRRWVPPEGSLAWAVAGARISVDAASLVRETLAHVRLTLDAAAAWEVERRLVAKAQAVSLAMLRKACWWERATADPEGWRKRERVQRAGRHLSIGEDRDGMITINGRLDPATAAPVVAWFDAQRKHLFQQARDTGVHEERTTGMINADLLGMLAAHATDCTSPSAGVKTTVVVRMTLEQLRGELDAAGIASCDQSGTPWSAARVRAMAVDARIVPVVLGGASLPLDVGRARRLFSPAQRTALTERYGGCAWCTAPPGWAEGHHLDSWARGGRTDTANGLPLCRACHLRLHDTGWEVRLHHGQPWFIPPASVDPDRTPILGGSRRYLPEDLPDPPPSFLGRAPSTSGSRGSRR